MAGCAAGLYLKGTLAQGIGMIFNALIGGVVAFGFFEIAAKYLINYASGMTPWAPTACFLVILVLVFALLQAVEMLISKEKVDLGVLPERIGRPLAGVVLGYLATGYLLVALAMAPLPSQYPYPRFESRNPNPASPKKALLSPDGFVTNLFGLVSKGSFSPIREPKSFALFHAGYLDQLYLNRHKNKEVPLLTTVAALDVPRKAGVWSAPEGLRDAEGKPPAAPAGTSLILVRVGIRKAALRDAGKFTFSQMRLVCGPKGSPAQPLAGQGQAVYPLGYIGAGGNFERKSLDEVLDISKASGDSITMDLAFPVPTNLTPVLLEFKRNNVVQVSAPATAEDAPQPIAFSFSAPAAAGKEPAGQSAGNVQAGSGQPGSSAPAASSGAKGKRQGKRSRAGEITKGVTSGQLSDD
jgi:hypothetical protein